MPSAARSSRHRVYSSILWLPRGPMMFFLKFGNCLPNWRRRRPTHENEPSRLRGNVKRLAALLLIGACMTSAITVHAETENWKQQFQKASDEYFDQAYFPFAPSSGTPVVSTDYVNEPK